MIKRAKKIIQKQNQKNIQYKKQKQKIEEKIEINNKLDNIPDNDPISLFDSEIEENIIITNTSNQTITKPKILEHYSDRYSNQNPNQHVANRVLQEEPKTNKRPIIEVKDIVKVYDNFLAVDTVSFEVIKGEIFGILGPNGAGKTTIMEIMETIISKTAGQVIIDGLDVEKYAFEIKKRIGVQLQATSFFSDLNLLELISLFADIYNVKVDKIKILDSINLVDKARSTINQLSKGQQQRFSLAISIISNPKIVFLDEPTTGLDPQARRAIWESIKELKNQGTTIVLTTHYMEEAEYLCDRIAIMNAGKILEINTIKGFIEKLLQKGFIQNSPKYSATLEDVFIDLTGKNLRD